MRLFQPTTLDQALQLLATCEQPLTPVAGGTDLLVGWHHEPKHDLSLLDLSHLGELRAFRLSGAGLELGALTTYWQIMSSPEVGQTFPLLIEAARQVGAIQIQSRGTWAGNIGNGSPAADGVPVLMAYDAVVVLQSSRETTEVPLEQYYTGYKQTVRRPDQLIRAIRIPQRQRAFECFHKVGARSAQAISKVGVAVVQDQLGWRVVANSVAPFVCRCRHLEQALEAGASFAGPQDLMKVLEADVSPIDDLRSTAAYRQRVLANLLFHQLNNWGRAARAPRHDASGA